MHDHRTPRDPSGDGSPGDVAERLLLLELVTDPPPAGDPLTRLASRLRLDPEALDRAADALVRSGLAVRDDDVVLASTAALRFEALWPICI